MNQLDTINSIVMARLLTGKPSVSAKLERQHENIVSASGAESDAVRAPSGRLFAKGGLVADAFSIINGMSVILRKKGNAVPDMVGATYLQAEDIDEIQKEFDERNDKLDQLKAQIRQQYASLVAAGQSHLGTLKNEIMYPTVDEFLDDFRFQLKWLGQPQGIEGTVLGAVSRETAARVRAASQKDAQSMLTEAHGRLVQTAIAEMGDVVTALTTGKRLRQERLDKLSRLADEIESKNWLKLPELHDTVAKLRELHVDASEIPLEDDRKKHAARIEAAREDASKTLASLGL